MLTVLTRMSCGAPSTAMQRVERVEAPLGDGVGRLEAVAADIGGVRAGADDAAAAGLAHDRHDPPAQVPRAREVDPEAPEPVLGVVVEDRAAHVDGGVVDQDLDRAEPGRDLVDDRVDLSPVTGVQRHADHRGRGVVSGDRAADLVGAALVDVGDDHGGAPRREPPGDRLPDALARPPR